MKVFCLKEEKEIVNGAVTMKNMVKVETIVTRLSEMTDLSIGEGLHILINMIDGYEAIFRKIGVCSVCLDKCGLNKEGVMKVWINNQFERNDVSGEILTNERNILEKILRIVDMITKNKL